MADLSTANTILSQLGGGRFTAMTGAKNLIGYPDALSMQIPSAKRGINRVKIKLDPSDTYTVTFGRYRAGQIQEISTHSDIYCDMLTDLFETETGLFTHF